MDSSHSLTPVHLDLPLSFRQEIVVPVFRALRAGSSVALVGLRGCGASNLLRFLCQPRTARANGVDPQHMLVAYVDDNLVRSYTERDVCRAAVDALAQAARHGEWPDAEIGPLLDAARHYGDYERHMTGVGVLARVADVVCREQDKRAAFVFDDFDSAFTQLDAPALRGLRAIRDRHRPALSLVVKTRVELNRLMAHRADGGSGSRPFVDLFERDTFAVGPYRRDDAVDLVRRKTSDWDRPITGDQIDLAVRVAGGYPSLLLAALACAQSRPDAPASDLALALKRDRRVEARCREVWLDLDPSEQRTLIELAAGRRVSPDDARTLRLRGLAVGHPPSVFCELMEDFAARQSAPVDDGQRLPSALRDP